MTRRARSGAPGALDQLHYEVMHNLVIETTRLGIEVKNLKMRVESLTSRLEFNERRARALESVVVYKAARGAANGDGRRAGTLPRHRPAVPPAPAAASAQPGRQPAEGPGQRSRRRRRRRGRRGGGLAAAIMGGPQLPATSGSGLTEAGDVKRSGDRCRRPPRASSARCPSESSPDPETSAGRSGHAATAVKLAVVVQRYGQAINGGAELHARYIAEHLARHAEVEVLTTCATDYVTWRNELPAGVETINGVPVRRFRVKHERDPLDFGRRSDRVFEQPHSLADELDWLDAEGPTSPSLVDYIAKHATRLRLLPLLQLSLLPRVPRRSRGGRREPSSCRPPSATRRSALSIFQAALPRRPRPHVQLAGRARDDPGGRRQPAGARRSWSASDRKCRRTRSRARFRQKFNVRGPFAVYVGRIDENKGCKELFEFFEEYLRERIDPRCRWS